MTTTSTILGAGGPIGNELAKILAEDNTPFRLVGRNPKPFPGAQMVTADLTDREQTIRAVAGSSVVYLVAGLKYDHDIWQQLWPRIMANTIEACKRAQSRLLFFDNVYMYGRVNGAMTEETPYAPCSKKGEVRANIATSLMNEVKARNLTAMIARSADFYGPKTQNSVPGVLVFEPFSNKKTASWLVNATVPHSLTFTPDAARGVALMVEKESAWNQVWHLPTVSNPPTGKEFIEMAAKEFATPPKFRVLGRQNAPRRRAVQSPGPRVSRDALPVRFSIPLRFVKVRARVWLRGNPLRRRRPNCRGFLPTSTIHLAHNPCIHAVFKSCFRSPPSQHHAPTRPSFWNRSHRVQNLRSLWPDTSLSTTHNTRKAVKWKPSNSMNLNKIYLADSYG